MGRQLARFAMTLAVLVGAVAMVAVPASPVRAGDDVEPEARTIDQLVMRNGKVIEGRVLEETSTSVRFEVHYPGLPPVATTYSRSDILTIRKGVPVKDGDAAEGTDDATEEDDDASEESGDYDADAAKVYLFEVTGEFGVHFSHTPFVEILEDADRVFDDKDANGMVKEEFRDRNIIVIGVNAQTDLRRGFDGIWVMEDGDGRIGIKTPLIEEKRKGRKVVFWVKNAFNGAALFPFLSPHIYFASDAHMAFTSNLEDFDIGDDVVDEKQISLRVATAEGYLNEGGHDYRILRPMVRSRYWLYINIRGGTPILHQKKDLPDSEAGWILLTDDGEGENEDPEDALFGNDRLVIDWQVAEWLGVSDGTADTINDIAFNLGIEKNYVVVTKEDDFETRATRILRDWREGLAKAEANIERLKEEYRETPVGGDYNDRKAARGKQIRILQQVISWLTRYEEVLDPDGGQRSQIRALIEEIRLASQLDKPSGGGGGGGEGDQPRKPGRGIG